MDLRELEVEADALQNELRNLEDRIIQLRIRLITILDTIRVTKEDQEKGNGNKGYIKEKG